MAFDDTGALKSPNNWPDDLAAVVASVETDELFEGSGEDRNQIGYTKKLKVWEKVKAIEALSKLMGYNEPDRKEIGGPGGGPIELSNQKLSDDQFAILLNAVNEKSNPG
jgi:phage terminase small subunit